MRLIIAGGRDYRITQDDMLLLDKILATYVVDQVVSGGATGADHGGELWAALRSIPIRRFQADWATYGNAAGPPPQCRNGTERRRSGRL